MRLSNPSDLESADLGSSLDDHDYDTAQHSLARYLYKHGSSFGTQPSHDRIPFGVSPSPHSSLSSSFNADDGYDGTKCLPNLPKWDKNDGRLHPDYPLYCEGMPKPKCRGVLHMVFTALLPFAYLHLVHEANGNLLGMSAAFVYIFSNIWCYGFSATYHIGKWAPKVEILLQKLDHAGIAIMSVGTFCPCAMLLFSPIEGGLFLILLIAACGWTIDGVIKNNPSLVRQVCVPSISFLFIYQIISRFTTLELCCYFMTIFLKVMGVVVFVNRRPDPFPSIFGYHEIFHVFVTLAGIFIYAANWSIIHRSCNPYAHRIDVLQHLVMIMTGESIEE